MIHFKNHKKIKLYQSGFTLIEAMLSMMIVGVVLTPLFVLHGVIMKRVNRSSQQLYALLWGKQLLYEARQKQDPDAQEFTLETKKEEFATTVRYTLDPGVDPKSTLASQVGLHRELVTIQWTDAMGEQRRETLVSYVYKQPEQKKQ